MKILVLSTANSCRSQMAAAFLKSFAPELEVFFCRNKTRLRNASNGCKRDERGDD